MSFTFSDEQLALRAAVRRFLDDTSPTSAARGLIDREESRDPAVWTQMAQQLGLQGLAIAESYGGAGCGPVELGLVMEEMGRVLLVAPYFSTVVLAGQTLTTFDDEAANAKWLPRIADGSLTATVALAEESGSWDPQSVEATATVGGAGCTVTGVKMFVPDGDTADLLLVVARAEGELGLFAVDASAPGVQRSRLGALDLTRPLARIELVEAPAERIVPRSGSAASALRRALDLAIIGLAAEQVGGAQRCLDMAVEYAKVRVQFGRPIGSFQAIKHKCAGMLLKVEFSRSAAYYASSAAAGDEADTDIAAALAASYCSDAYSSVAKDNIQVHGGIGFTWEHDAHLYLKRAKTCELLFGTPAGERERIADLAGI